MQLTQEKAARYPALMKIAQVMRAPGAAIAANNALRMKATSAVRNKMTNPELEADFHRRAGTQVPTRSEQPAPFRVGSGQKMLANGTEV